MRDGVATEYYYYPLTDFNVAAVGNVFLYDIFTYTSWALVIINIQSVSVSMLRSYWFLWLTSFAYIFQTKPIHGVIIKYKYYINK